MRADSPEKVIIIMNFKSETIKHIDAGFPSVFMPLHLFNSQGRMIPVLRKKPNFFIKHFLYMQRELLVVLFKGVCADDPHALRSARNSSTEEKDFILLAVISESASFSAFCQSKEWKYGGSIKAYFKSSDTAVLSSEMWACFLKSYMPLKTSSEISIVILWLDFIHKFLSLLIKAYHKNIINFNDIVPTCAGQKREREKGTFLLNDYFKAVSNQCTQSRLLKVGRWRG